MNFAITRRGEYGLTAVLYLANRPAGDLTQIHEIADQCSLPEPFLAQILRLLVRSGLVVSKKGVRGGFSLSRPASKISFLEVLEALEGPVAVNRCQSPIERCMKEGCCSMEGIWARAQEALTNVLSKTSISEAMCLHQFPFVPAAQAAGASRSAT